MRLWAVGLIVLCVGVLLLVGCVSADDAPVFTTVPSVNDEAAGVSTAFPATTTSVVVAVPTTLSYTQQAIAGRLYGRLLPLYCDPPDAPDFASAALWAEFQADGVDEWETRRDEALARMAEINLILWPVEPDLVLAVFDEAATHAINYDRLAQGTVGSRDTLDWSRTADSRLSIALAVPATTCV
jgi:hypothetical protein